MLLLMWKLTILLISNLFGFVKVVLRDHLQFVANLIFFSWIAIWTNQSIFLRRDWPRLFLILIPIIYRDSWLSIPGSVGWFVDGEVVLFVVTFQEKWTVLLPIFFTHSLHLTLYEVELFQGLALMSVCLLTILWFLDTEATLSLVLRCFVKGVNTLFPPNLAFILIQRWFFVAHCLLYLFSF